MLVETSLVIRTLNESRHLEKLFTGIQRQNYKDWEIILVDSGSTDGTLEIAARHGARIYHIAQEEFTYGRSLNLGCEKAQGQYLVFASGHVWPVTNNWLGNLVKPFEQPSIAMVYGRQRGTDANRISELRDLNSHFGRTSNIQIDEPKGNNANSAIRRDLWLQEPFDESLPGLEDVDWARRVERKGYRVYYAADAAVYHVHEETLRQVYRRYLRETIASKRMFPHNQFTLSDVLKGLPYFVARDILYAFRNGKQRKVFQIPGTRLAQFLGIHQGFRYQGRLSRESVRGLEVPDTFLRVVVDGPQRHGLRSEPLPQLKPDEVLVQVAYAGVCAADVAAGEGAKGPNGIKATCYPMVPGHEFSGIVVKTGAGVRRLRIGQKVAGDYRVAGGEGPRRGINAEAGGRLRAGAYADYLVTPRDCLHRLPPDMPLKLGAMIQPVAGCLASLRELGIKGGDRVCVVGAGSLGNLCVQILRARGGQVTAVDPNSRWLSLLHKYDVDTLNELDSLEDYDHLVEATGDPEVRAWLLAKSDASASLVLLDLPCRLSAGQGFEVLTGNRVVKETLAGGHVSWGEAVHLVRHGIVRLDDHTASVRPLEAYQEAWASSARGEYLKVLLSTNKELEAL
jgi:threonine dehydrogenase-like Zn-dependent dehydrogenase/glycosyltransferase involved in cell wall biosynthesis